MRILSILTVLCLTTFLQACNTVEGAGEDIQKGGEAISGASQDAQN